MTVSTSDLCDRHADEIQVLDGILRHYGGRTSFYGALTTVRCFEDNSVVKRLSQQPGEGRLIVVDGGGSLRRALLGDLIAADLQHHGWAGIVINGCVRDVDALRSLDLGILAISSVPLKTERRGLGDQDVPLRFAGATFEPGNWLYADTTGVIVSRQALPLSS
ncbi:MAG: ribonuclease E activity regulator RraA [Gammaproteobacteria bacterium]|nr:ribonuclease E activity regulator RraA [Gammaproteobacteria bacterium]